MMPSLSAIESVEINCLDLRYICTDFTLCKYNASSKLFKLSPVISTNEGARPACQALTARSETKFRRWVTDGVNTVWRNERSQPSDHRMKEKSKRKRKKNILNNITKWLDCWATRWLMRLPRRSIFHVFNVAQKNKMQFFHHFAIDGGPGRATTFALAISRWHCVYEMSSTSL